MEKPETPNEMWKRLMGKTSTKDHRYGNIKVKQDGITFDSKAELAYKGILDLRVKVGEIKGYDYHVKLPLFAQGGQLIGHYEVDYLVYLNDGGQEFHDVKAPMKRQKDIFIWKAKHVKAQYGNPVILINSKTFERKPL